jgi:hypothetical protein
MPGRQPFPAYGVNRDIRLSILGRPRNPWQSPSSRHFEENFCRTANGRRLFRDEAIKGRFHCVFQKERIST